MQHEPAISKLLEIMSKLRDKEKGCPWDLEQNLSSILPHTIEEVYEVVDAIERNDMEQLKEELGDLLFQIVFYTQLTQEEGLFNFDDVAAAISEKLIARHPHIFGNTTIRNAQEQTEAWESFKAEERKQKATQQENQHTSILDNIPLALPALLRASKIQKRVAKHGFNWERPEDLFDKITEEVEEIRDAVVSGEPSERIAEEIGDLLFCLCNLSNFYDINPEEALRKSNHKFTKRFYHLEDAASQQDTPLATMSFEELNQLWDQAKLKK